MNPHRLYLFATTALLTVLGTLACSSGAFADPGLAPQGDVVLPVSPAIADELFGLPGFASLQLLNQFASVPIIAGAVPASGNIAGNTVYGAGARARGGVGNGGAGAGAFNASGAGTTPADINSNGVGATQLGINGMPSATGGSVGATAINLGLTAITGGAGGAGASVASPGEYEGGSGGAGGGAGVFLSGGQYQTYTGLTIRGGNGGKGGGISSPQAPYTGSGGGGGGGAGAIVTGQDTSLLNAKGATIIGGLGGDAGAFPGGQSGGFGNSGDGVVVNGGATFKNLGVVRAGDNSSDLSGSAGAGLRLGFGTHVINNGSIANGVDIVGNDNVFEIWNASRITGNVVVASGTSGNVFAWGGDDDGTFDLSAIGQQYQGFQGYRKEGQSTWTLTGAGTFDGGITIAEGTLQIGDGTTASSVTGDIENNGTLVFKNSDPSAFAGVVSGTGRLRQSGSGVLLLSGMNTYTGGTEIDSGILSVSADANLGAAAGDLTFGGGTLQLGSAFDIARLVHLADAGTIDTNGHDSTFSGVFDGAGRLLKAGVGTLTLSGVNTYTGGTEIDSGILSVSADANLGAAAGGLTLNGGTLQLGGAFNTARLVHLTGAGTIDTNGHDSIFSSAFDGAGRLTKAGAGTLTLAGNNTYAGGTIISAGTLQVGNGSAAGAIAGDVVNNGKFAFNRSNAYTFSGNISGTGSVTQSGSGLLTLSGSNTYTGGTVIDRGILSVSSDSNLGAAAGDLTFSGGSLQLGATLNSTRLVYLAADGTIDTNGHDGTFSGAFDGTGRLTKSGGGTLVLSGSNGYTGGTAIDGGTLSAGADNNLGAASGDLTFNGGELALSDSFDVARAVHLEAAGGTIFTDGNDSTFSGVIDGTGALTKIGVGTLTLSGTNTYTGGTAINGGTLLISRDENLGDKKGDLTIHGGILQLGGELDTNRLVHLTAMGMVDTNGNNGMFSNTIDGAGSLTKMGAGTLTLSGTNTYTGGTRVMGGVLSISDDRNLGASTGALSIDNGTLLLTADLTSGRSVMLGVHGGTIETAASTSSTFSGVFSNAGKLTKAGDGTLILTGANTYNGGTTVSGGILQIGNGGATGSIMGNVTLDTGAALAFNRSDDITYTGLVSGSGALHQDGAGTLILTGTNSYTGGTTISSGTLQIGDGGGSGSIQGNVTNNGTLAFNRSNTLSFSGVVSGSGMLNQIGSGSLTLSGDSSAFTGATNVNAGGLIVTGKLGDATSTLQVASNASLAGSGTIGGNTTIADGATLIGAADQTLTFNDNLSLGTNSTVSVTYGANAGQPFFDVKSDLALGGTIDVTDFGGNGPGIYRVFNYGGALSGTIAIGALPGTFKPNEVSVDVTTPHAVNLINSHGVALNFWDGDGAGKHNNGVLDGGDGTWDTVSGNWTEQPDFSIDGPWETGGFAIFGGAKGKVQVANGSGAVSAAGMQFLTDGYEITGDKLTLAPSADSPDDAPTIRVGDGSADDASKTAIISAELGGTDGMRKTGLGTLILTGDNTYTGGTFVTDGKLQLGSGDTSGSVQGEVNLGSTASSAGTLVIDYSGTVQVSNEITGAGHVEIVGPGTVELTGASSYLSGTLVNDGSTVVISSDDNLGAVGNGIELDNDSTLRFKAAFDSNHNYVLAGGAATIETTGTNTNTIITAVTGAGSLTKAGTGTLVLAADSNYAGGTTVSGGTLQIGNGGTTGSIAGNITNNGAVVFNRSGAVAMGNVISGTGSVAQAGSGTLTLTGANTYSGGTTVSAGTLQVASDGNLGDATGGLTIDGGTFGNTGAIATGRSITVTTNGGTVQTDADLTLTGAFDASVATGDWHKTGAGELIFDATATGNVGSGAAVDAGKVSVKGTLDGDFAVNTGGVLDVSGTQRGNINVNDGGTLVGSGSIGQNVAVADNGALQGTSGQTLTVNGDLTLNANSQMNVSLGMSNQTALFDVAGNLTLAGTLNITDGGGFGAGYYHLVNYQGSLTDNTMVIGAAPAGIDPSRIWIDTSVDHQVNLTSATGVRLNVWDGGDLANHNNGRIDGGSGDWDTTNNNWTDNQEKVNGRYDQGSFAVFSGKAGTVHIDDSKANILAAGLQFATDGYRLTGDALNLDNTGQPIIRVGDGSAAGKAITATIEVELQGSKGINKTDYGTLILTGANHYSGDTTVTGGVLQIGADNGASGSIDGNVMLASDLYGHGTLAFARSDGTTFAGNISGVGNVVQKGSGTTTFIGDNSYSGGLTVENGIAQAGMAGHTFGTGVLKVKTGARADLNGFDTTVGGLASFDATGATGDGDITLGSGKLTVEQGFDSRFSGVLSGTGDFTKSGSAALTLAGSNQYTGATLVNQGTLIQGSQDAFSSASAYTTARNGTLDLGGYDTTVSSLDNGGTVNLSDLTAGTTLTVAGNYTGSNGTLVINTVLGDDNSRTDRLKVGGDTSGTTNLQVVNRGGLGGQTVNGIEVVDVTGQSNGTFSLVSDYTTKDNKKAIWAGAYAYTLQQGSGSGNKDGNWYLVSRYGDPDPVDPNKPTGPRYGAGVPVYQGYGENMQALNKLPTLQERVGNRYWTGENGDGQTNGAMVDGNGIWARIEGAHNRLEPQSVTGVKQDINTFIMQAGVDGQFYEDDNGKLVAGITGQYGTAHGSSSSFFGDGYTDTRAWSLGATATWYGNNGFYVDMQGQLTWFDNDLSSDDMNSSLASGAKAFGYAMSVEAGQRVAIDDHWSLTPQAQLMWSSLDADAFQDVMGNRVGLDNANSLTARLGLAASYRSDWTGEDGRMVNTSVYGVANLYQSFLGGMRINVAGVDIDTDTDKTWAGIGAGGSYAWEDQKYAVYGEGSINTSLNHFANSYALKGTVGFKVKW
ncbi:MAG: autotransporter-associated beta strand repeat-containing protein [Brucella sp.]